MKKTVQMFVVLAAFASVITSTPVNAQGTMFTYQGRLGDGANPASGSYDLTFTLYDTNQPVNNLIAGPLTNSATIVTNGLFTVTLDFGNPFDGTPRWLEIGVRTNGIGAAFTTLMPRQQITPTPYAITAGNVFGLRVAPSTTDAPNLIGGASVNVVDAGVKGAVIAGGGTTNYFNTSSSNRVSADFSSIGGGSGNAVQAGADHAAIGGGLANIIGSGAHYSVVAGGWANSILNPYSFIGGGNINVVNGNYSAIGGGYQNHASSDYVSIGGGEGNTGSSLAATVSGGDANTASGGYSTVSGGVQNFASGANGTVSGGQANMSSGFDSTVGGGQYNIASGDYSTVAGGWNNRANNAFATVPGGEYNLASGQKSFAAGLQAQATNDGAFVWADSQGTPFTSTNNDSFNVRAQGGVRFVTGGAGLTVDGQAVLTNNQSGPVTFNGTLTLPATTATIYSGADLLLHSDENAGNFFVGPGAGNLTMSAHQDTALGYAALYLNISGNYNTALGYAALASNTNGSDNTASGSGALQLNVKGNNNTAQGYAALESNTNGNNNTAQGYGALFSNNGTNNTALGYLAGRNLTSGSNNIDIGNLGVAGENNTIRIGTPGIQTTTFIAGMINGDGGGLTNLNASQFSNGTGLTIQQNSSGAPNIIAGSSANSVASGVYGATISGGGATNYFGLGYTNSVSADFGTVSGGADNTASSGFATVGGGYFNTASNIYATVAGGVYNTAGGEYATVAGGYLNTAISDYATASGGQGNQATALGATVAGGVSGIAGGQYSTVPGGTYNSALGNYSFAAGNQAKALHQGAFVWADSQGANFSSTTNDEFSIRAQNGVRIQADKGIHLNAADEPIIVRDWNPFATNAPAAKAGIGRWGLFMEPTYLTIGIPDTNGIGDTVPRYFQVAKYSTNGNYSTLVLVDETGNLFATNNVYAKGVQLTSDRNAKEHFTPLDAKAVLAKVTAMPVTEWNYKDDDTDKKHIGPMAQDFHAAFGLDGADDRHISVVDEGGVALAAIQGLNQKVEDRSQNSEVRILKLETETKQKDAEIQDLKQRLEGLEKIVLNQRSN